MTVIAAGSSAQLVIALLIVLVNMLVVLKLGPFVDSVDDYLSFLTSLQMLLTLLGGLLIKTDNPSLPTYDPVFMGVSLVVVNSCGFVALFLSLVALHPKIRTCIDGAKRTVSTAPGNGAGAHHTKIAPVDANEQAVKSWGADTGEA